MKELEYETLHKTESFGKADFGLEIRVSLGRAITSADRKAAYRAADALEDALLRETIRLDPVSAENAAKERGDLIRLFESPIYVEEIPNGYCSRWCCSQSPWLVVTTRKGRITIGWRKRVININWEGSAIAESADVLFPNEDVTKSGRVIHAWGLNRAKEYISILLGTPEAT